MPYVEPLKPIDTCPKDGSYFLAWGPSGYNTTPMRCEVCHWDAEYRPLNPLQTHSNDAFTDGGAPATHWSPLPFDAGVLTSEILALKDEIAKCERKIKELGGSL
jgi:hypothetical protein